MTNVSSWNQPPAQASGRWPLVTAEWRWRVLIIVYLCVVWGGPTVSVVTSPAAWDRWSRCDLPGIRAILSAQAMDQKESPLLKIKQLEIHIPPPRRSLQNSLIKIKTKWPLIVEIIIIYAFLGMCGFLQEVTSLSYDILLLWTLKAHCSRDHLMVTKIACCWTKLPSIHCTKRWSYGWVLSKGNLEEVMSAAPRPGL